MKPHKKVTPGMHHGASPLKSANFINHLVDMVNWWKGGGVNHGSGHGLIRGQRNRSSGVVYVQNQTGEARSKGDVVQLGNYLFSEPDDRAFWFAGETPAEPADQRFAILDDPAGNDNFMYAARISGRAWANVNVVSTDHKYATPEAGQHVLKSTDSGAIELLHTPTAEGLQMLPVRLSSAPGGTSVTTELFEIIGLAGSTPGNGTTPEDIRYWRAKRVLFIDGEYQVDPTTEPYTHHVYDPLRIYAGKTLARWHAAFFNTQTSHWELLPGFVGGKWGKAISRWQNGNHPYVEVNPCLDGIGTGADTSTVLAVALPKMAGKDPNVRSGDVIAYTQVGTGTGNTSNLCISNYLDDKLGTIKIWRNAISSIPAGWALADGSANSIANGGSGQNLTAKFLVGYQSGHPDHFQIGNTGTKGQAGSAAIPWYTVAWIERIV